jgi:hypothetical protein
MRILLFATLLLAAPSPGAAQTGPEPNLILTLFGGATAGHSLWKVSRQPLCLYAANYSCSSLYDTLELTRNISASLVLGASGVYFKGPHLGIEGEIFYLGLPFDDTCRGVYYNPDPNEIDQQVCLNIDAASPSTSAIGFYGGLVLRAAARHLISPYVRAGVGLVTYSGGTVELSGAFVDASGSIRSRAVYLEDNPRTVSSSIHAAAGVTTRISSGYQFRLEVHDAIVPLNRVTGPADDLARPPTASHSYHQFILTMGLDVVLEKKRGRRY